MTEQALEATKFQEVAGSILARSLKSATTPPFNSPLKHTEEQKTPLPLKPGIHDLYIYILQQNTFMLQHVKMQRWHHLNQCPMRHQQPLVPMVSTCHFA